MDSDGAATQGIRDAKEGALPSVAATEANAPEDPLALLARIQTTDGHHPVHWSWHKKWLIVAVYCLLQVFVMLTSTTYVSVEFLIMEKWTSSQQVATLGQSMFLVGNAVGPAFLGTCPLLQRKAVTVILRLSSGPLSDIGGRKWVYVVSSTTDAAK